MTSSILFVCTANICRSPMAAGIFAEEARKRGDADRYSVSSAGTWAKNEEPATGNAQSVMAHQGLSLRDHRARTIDQEMLADADLVLVMTKHHLDALVAEFPETRSKIHMLSELVELQYDVGDPYGGSLGEYQLCAAELSQLIERGYRRVGEWLEVSSVSDRAPTK